MWYVISGRELEQYLDEGYPLFLVDMREPLDYEKVHIAGAVNAPTEVFWEKSESFPKDKFIVLYCYHGPNSMRAARELAKKGYQVADVYGGISAYRGKYMVYSR